MRAMTPTIVKPTTGMLNEASAIWSVICALDDMVRETDPGWKGGYPIVL